MQDLSHVSGVDPINVLIPTSQHGGNQVWQNTAMTAPGGASGDLGNDLNQAVVVDAPEIDAEVYDTPVLIGEGGAKVHADKNDARPSLYNRADGTGWFSGEKTAPTGGTAPPPGYTGKWINC